MQKELSMKRIETIVGMERSRSLFRSRLGAAVLGLGLALGAGGAQAADVYWSLGVQAAPGVVIGASNAAPVYVAPAPVVVYPAPMVVHPAPRFLAPPVHGVAWAPPGHFKRKDHSRHGHDGWRSRGGHEFEPGGWSRHRHGRD